VTRLPDRIQIGPHDVAIVVERPTIDSLSVKDQMKLHGHYEPESNLIVLRPGMHRDYEAEVVVHEVLHALTALTGIISDLGEDQEEKFVERLAPVVLDTMRRNPDLLDYLTGGTDADEAV
jgi:hypothetical protein